MPGKTRARQPTPERQRPARGVRLRSRSRTPPPQRRAGDLTHAMVQLDESAIAGNVGRDLAFAASRLAARPHPGVGGCAAPSSLVIFGISQPTARSTEGCSSPPGQRWTLLARDWHDHAHICRGDDGRGTSRSRATTCSRRVHRAAKRTASWLARARLGLDCHEFSSASSRACTRVRLMGTAAAHALCAPHSRPPATHRRRPRVGRPGFPLSS